MPQDNLTTDIVSANKDRNANRSKQLDAELDALVEAQNAPKVQVAPVPAGLQAPPRKEPGMWQETSRAIGGGLRDAAQNTLDLAHDAGTWLGENLLNLRMASGPSSRINLPKVAENQTTGGKVARSVVQFLTPYLGATKFLKTVAPGMGAVTKGITAGAATDFAAFDPHEKRLSNMVMELSNNEPAVGKEIFSYLAADPNDTSAEGRFKNALEGMGIGLAVEGLFKGIRVLKAHYTTKGQDPADAVQKAAEASKKEAEEAAKKAEADKANVELDAKLKAQADAKAMPLVDQINALTGVKKAGPDYAKRLDVLAATKEPKAPKAEPAPLPKTGEPEKTRTPQATLIAKFEAAESATKQGTAHRVILDADGNLSFTKDAPAAAEVDLGTKVKLVMEKDPATHTAEDLLALRAYRQLQEAAFPGIAKATDEVPAASGAPLEVVSSRARPKEAPPTVVMGAKSDHPKFAEEGTIAFSKDAPTPGGKVITGDTPEPKHFDLETKAKVALEKNPLERTAEDLAVIRAHGQSRAASASAIDTSGDVAAAVKSNNAKIAAIVGAVGTTLVSPAVLANMVTPAVGAAAGAASADEDDDFATMLTLAGVGALAAYGIKVKVGKNAKVLSPAERELVSNPDPAVASLARKEVANIAPVDPNLVKRKVPVISSAKVSQMVKSAVSGDYKTVSQAMDESDFNFNHIDTPEDVKEMIDGFSSVFEKEIDKAKHGVQTFEQTKELAEELGAGKETMKLMYEGTDNLAARVLAHRSLLAASAEKVTSLAKIAMNGDADAILALRKHVALHASIQAQMKGVQTEVARALSQFRITASSVDLAVNERNQLIEAMGGHKANMEFAKKLSEISDTKKLGAVVRKGAMARTKDAMFEAWINGLLSGPATHVVNMVGNGLTALNSVAERGTAAMIGKVLRTDNAIQAGEAKAQLFGMVEGLKDAVHITAEGLDTIRKSATQVATGDLKGAGNTLTDNLSEFGGMWKAAITDAPVLDSAAFATKEMHPPAITAGNFNLDSNTILGGAVDGLGALVRLPGRALTTSDELFKTIHYRGELKAQAYRMARSEGLEGEALFKRIGELVEDPTPALQAQALHAARQGTFTTPLGSLGASMQNLVMNVPGGRYIMPFVRTPVNLMKFVGVRTPGLNLLAESVRNEFKAGGVRRDVMLAKTAMGGAMYALGAHFAAQGVITGGGEKDQSAEKLGGVQPYSIKVGNTYYAFNRFDPFGAFLGLAADLTDISGHISADEMDQVASAATLALSRNLVSKTYLSGLIDLIDTISSGSEAKWQKYLQRQAGTIIPSGLAAVRREVDPEVKEVWTMVDAIKARVPGYSKDVPPLVNIFGEDVVYKGGLGPDIASPVYTSEATTEPAAAEIARLNLDLRHPPRSILGVGGGPGIDLTPKQYYRYMKLIGNEAKSGGKGFKDALTELVQSDAYKALPEDPDNSTYPNAKEKVITLMFEAYKRQAQAMLIQEDPQLRQAYEINLRNAGNALAGKPLLQLPPQ